MMNDALLKGLVKMELVKGKMINAAKSKISEDKGVAATEYALVMALVVGVVVTAAYAMNDPLQKFFEAAVAKLKTFLD